MENQDFTNIIVNLASQIDGLTQSFLFKGYATMSQALAKPIASVCVLYIMLTGYGILRGLIKTPMQEFVTGSIRIGLVCMLALNWDTFSFYFTGLFVDGASWLGGIMMQLTPFNLPQAHTGGVNEALQSVFTEVVSVGTWVSNKGTFRNLGPYFSGWMIHLSGFLVVGLAFFELLAAKLMLSICMVCAPLFVSLTLFDKTRSYFDKWLGSLVGFSLVLVMVSAVVGLCANILHWVIGPHYSTQAEHLDSTGWIPLLLVALFSMKAIIEVTGIAKSIGGACCTSSGSAMVGSFVGAALGASRRSGLSRLTKNSTGLLGKMVGKGAKWAGKSAFKGLQKRIRGA